MFMDEIAYFLRESGLQVIVQEGYEFQRYHGSLWMMTSRYDSNSLRSEDPSHFTTNDRKEIKCLSDILLPADFTTYLDWRFEVIHTKTDKRGWMYMSDFSRTVSTPVSVADAQVRYRKWQRTIISLTDLPRASDVVSNFVRAKSHFRSLCAPLIQLALAKYEFQLQMVLECERSVDGVYAKSHLSEHLGDPPRWCAGPAENLTINPTKIPVSSLRHVEATIFNSGNGWDVLHEFIFTLYPERDSLGWEYNVSFDLDNMWSAKPTKDSVVRRRLWIRTCVRNHALYDCRQALQRYIHTHARGIFKTGHLQRQSHYRKRWSEGLAVLTDTHIELTLENNYQGFVEYSLKDCEAIRIDNVSDVDRSFQFGMRKIGSGGSDGGVLCVFNAISSKERDDWITALTHQIALVNLRFWPLEIGPPTADGVLFKGEMWKRGHVVPTWKFRAFELRQGGTLAYFKNGVLRGKIRVQECVIRDVPDDGEYAFEVVKPNGYSLCLRTSDALTKRQWLQAIQDRIDDVRSPQKEHLSSYDAPHGEAHIEDAVDKERLVCPSEPTGSLDVNPERFPSANPPVVTDDDFHEWLETSSPATCISPVAASASITATTGGDCGANPPFVDYTAESNRTQDTGTEAEPYCPEKEFEDWLQIAVDSERKDSKDTIDGDDKDMATVTKGESSIVADNKSGEASDNSALAPLHVFKFSSKSDRRASTGPGVPMASARSGSEEFHTHDVQFDKKTGRRVSVLNEALAERVVEAGGLWEADDEEDDSEEEEDEGIGKRISSFNAATARTSTLRLVFADVERAEEESVFDNESARSASGEALAIVPDQQSSDESAGGSKSINQDHNSTTVKPNVMSSVFGFLARRRSSV